MFKKLFVLLCICHCSFYMIGGNLWSVHSFLDTIAPRNQTVLDGAYVCERKMPKEEIINPRCNRQFQYSDSIFIGKRKRMPTELQNMLKNYWLIPGGTFQAGYSDKFNPLPEDKTLLFLSPLREVKVGSFLMCNHEVTNKEYREFVMAVLDSCMRDFLVNAGLKKFSLNEVENPTFSELKKNYMLNYKEKMDMNEEDVYENIWNEFYKQGTDKFYDGAELESRKIRYRFSEVIDHDTVFNLVAIYPDTNCWADEFKFGFLEIWKEEYFWHPAYSDYPVVGVSAKQAEAFCHWKTLQLQNALNKQEKWKNVLFHVRLPEEDEWEYAADAIPNPCMRLRPENSANRKANSIDRLKRPLDNANSGLEIDGNGVLVRNYDSDGNMYTARCASYPDNKFGIFDMFGNVAEWTANSYAYKPDSGDCSNNLHCKYLSRIPLDSLCGYPTEIVKEKIRKCNTPLLYEANSDEYESLLTTAAEWVVHDLAVLRNCENPRVVKGGSWAKPAVYLEHGLKEIYDENDSSCMVGFRLVLDVPKEFFPYFNSVVK